MTNDQQLTAFAKASAVKAIKLNYMETQSFNAEFGQYLKANGYIPGSQSEYSETIYYFKQDHGIMISGDSVDFGVFNQEKPGCSLYAAFTGISKLDMRAWKMLLHITGAVPMNLSQAC